MMPVLNSWLRSASFVCPVLVSYFSDFLDSSALSNFRELLSHVQKIPNSWFLLELYVLSRFCFPCAEGIMGKSLGSHSFAACRNYYSRMVESGGCYYTNFIVDECADGPITVDLLYLT